MSFGNLMCNFRALPYRGKKLRFRAMVRFAGVGAESTTHMWMRIDRANNAGMGFFDNMQNRPITANAWRPYEITGPVANDAEYISIGLFLLGDGKA